MHSFSIILGCIFFSHFWNGSTSYNWCVTVYMAALFLLSVHKTVLCLRFNEVQFFRIMWQRLLAVFQYVFSSSHTVIHFFRKTAVLIFLRAGVAICLSSGQWYVSRSNTCTFWFGLVKRSMSSLFVLPSFLPPYFFLSFLPHPSSFLSFLLNWRWW